MTRYDSFLLRVWRDQHSEARWAGRVEHVQDGRSVRFTTPEGLLEYLRVVIGAVPLPEGEGAAEPGSESRSGG